MDQSEKKVDDFLASIENETRKKDGLFIIDMMRRITKQNPKVWGPSIIGFGDYLQVYESGHQKKLPLIAFSPRKQHQVLYVLNNFKNEEVLLSRLGKHKRGNICLYINKIADVDIPTLEEIITCSYEKVKKKKYSAPED